MAFQVAVQEHRKSQDQKIAIARNSREEKARSGHGFMLTLSGSIFNSETSESDIQSSKEEASKD